MRKLILIALLWVTCSVATTGTFYASSTAKFPSLYCGEDEDARYRRAEALGDAMFLSLFGPASLAVSPFVTGFYFYGWRVTGCGR